MQNKVPVFTVNGNKMFGTNRLEHFFQIAPIGVPGYMDVGTSGCKHLTPDTVEVVDNRKNRPLIARNKP